MIIRESMQAALNDQLHFELHSSYIYLAMAAYLDKVDLTGAAKWMRVQAKEELEHAMKFYGYLYERQGEVTLKAVEAPRADYGSLLETFEEAYAHEQKVTERIHALVDQALTEKDHASVAFLQWFVTEQVEEEARAKEIIQKIKLLGESRGSLFMLDRDLGKRAG